VNVFIAEVKTAGGRLETGQNMLKDGNVDYTLLARFFGKK
jgi:hypothetical protein